MSQSWYSEDAPPESRMSAMGVIRLLIRGIPLGINTFGCLLLLLLVRLAERPLFGQTRPITPWITRYVCRMAFVFLGMRYRVEGKPMARAGAIVSNHASWLDIFALNAPQSIYFVAKAEVASWPWIGWLARATGTIFIERTRSKAAEHKSLLKSRLKRGHRLVFFPEGTSTDGIRVLPFRSTLFSAFFDADMPEGLMIQPVTLVYEAPPGEDARYYGWWGDMTFGGHLAKVLAAQRAGGVRVIFHPPVALEKLGDRKRAAKGLEETVRGPFMPEGAPR